MKGVVDIFNKRILDFCKLISDIASENGLIYSYFFLAASQSINQYHSAWCTCTTYQNSTSYVSIFLVSCKREGEERKRDTPPSQHYYFLFFQVGCTAMLFHTGFYSATRNWRELYKNLTVLSSLDAYSKNQILSKELMSFQRVHILNNS